MPLISQIRPSEAMAQKDPNSAVQMGSAEQVAEKDQDRGYEDFKEYDHDECVENHMEGSVLHRSQPAKSTMIPDLPQRSERRASKTLDSVMLDLQAFGANKEEADRMSMAESSDPLEHYLSSEEDGSLSDEYDDYLSDLGETSSDVATATRAGSSRASSRKSQEITAVAISFQIAGKPQIIEISIPQHYSPQSVGSQLSMKLDTLSNPKTFSEPPKRSLLRRPAPLNLRDSALRDSRRMSTSSMASSHSSNIAPSPYVPSSSSYIPSNSSYISSSASPSVKSSNTPSSLPTRKTSRLAGLATIVTQTKSSLQRTTTPSHTFLNSDPFASTAQETNAQSVESETPITPKTPTNIAATAFKRGFKRSLSIARKTSMPKISLAYTAGVVPSRADSISKSREADEVSIHSIEDEIVEQKIDLIKRHESMPVTPNPCDGPLRCQDAMDSSIGALLPAQASPVKERKGSLMSFGRVLSVKTR